MERHRKAVVRVKGAIAEGEDLRSFPGHADKIRLTVASAESYVLIARRCFPNLSYLAAGHSGEPVN